MLAQGPYVWQFCQKTLLWLLKKNIIGFASSYEVHPSCFQQDFEVIASKKHHFIHKGDAEIRSVTSCMEYTTSAAAIKMLSHQDLLMPSDYYIHFTPDELCQCLDSISGQISKYKSGMNWCGLSHNITAIYNHQVNRSFRLYANVKQLIITQFTAFIEYHTWAFLTAFSRMWSVWCVSAIM